MLIRASGAPSSPWQGASEGSCSGEDTIPTGVTTYLLVAMDLFIGRGPSPIRRRPWKCRQTMRHSAATSLPARGRCRPPRCPVARPGQCTRLGAAWRCMPRIPPPLIALSAGVAQRLLSPEAPAPTKLRAAAVVIIGLASAGTAGAAAKRFKRSGTTFEPFHPDRVSVLVTSGPNAITRNPMYLGMAGFLLANAVHRGSWGGSGARGGVRRRNRPSADRCGGGGPAGQVRGGVRRVPSCRAAVVGPPLVAGVRRC